MAAHVEHLKTAIVSNHTFAFRKFLEHADFECVSLAVQCCRSTMFEALVERLSRRDGGLDLTDELFAIVRQWRRFGADADIIGMTLTTLRCSRPIDVREHLALVGEWDARELFVILYEYDRQRAADSQRRAPIRVGDNCMVFLQSRNDRSGDYVSMNE